MMLSQSKKNLKNQNHLLFIDIGEGYIIISTLFMLSHKIKAWVYILISVQAKRVFSLI